MLEVKGQLNALGVAQQVKASGGSGSDVTVTQVLESGTKIATIKVDDDSTDLYCETVPATYDADDVVYDNTSSGLTATNVQEAIDEIAQGGGSGEWILSNTVTGNTPIAIPSGATEIILFIDLNGQYVYNVHIIVSSLANNMSFTGGYYMSAQANTVFSTTYNAGSFTLGVANVAGASVLTGAKTSLYYK